MAETGIEGCYALKNGKKLRFGYTTGTCAAAAAKAAAMLLAAGRAPETVDLMTPKGIPLHLEVLEPRLENGSATCAVKKFSGDDPDVTDGILVYATVCWQREPGIAVDGGLGVGRVTKPGLKQKIGEAAINPVPQKMIRDAVSEALDDCGQSEGARVVISIPEGVELAKKTFNPRLGIEGGISVLGTSGIVEPMSEAALVESIDLEIRQKRALGCERLIVSPGNYGADLLKTICKVRDEELVKCSNYIGQTVDMAAAAEFPELMLVSHIGKAIKLAAGIMNTHSREADGRADAMAACALRAGADGDTARKILDCLTTDEMLDILDEAGLLEKTMAAAGEKIAFYLSCRAKERLTIGTVVFSNERGVLFTTGPAEEWLRELEART